MWFSANSLQGSLISTWLVLLITDSIDTTKDTSRAFYLLCAISSTCSSGRRVTLHGIHPCRSSLNSSFSSALLRFIVVVGAPFFLPRWVCLWSNRWYEPMAKIPHLLITLTGVFELNIDYDCEASLSIGQPLREWTPKDG
jgi:hypothetical protein